ncbi:MAG TPA: FAD:protein FMN transferase [Candidatus Dormibacteraeota bacterium]|jgi:thiamine biosynthesis lipoprotein|nr:FAD:protein FMN transferase [Candidatus Dormibacteraeota bacterium]
MMIALKSWKALGTSVHVLTADGGDLSGAEMAVREILQDVDLAYSRFRTDSELSRLNARGGQAVQVGPLLARAIGVALQAARATGGAVDPTIGKAIRVAGYDDDFARLTADRGPVTLRAVSVPGWRVIRFDAVSRTVQIPAGVELDLGSTGKALAADMAATAALAAIDSPGALVSLGGDIATAGRPPEGGWRVLVSEDSNVPPDSDGQVLCIQRGGIATSSTTVRRWSRGKASLHHIIDPQTSRPTDGPWRTVTVLAGNCVDANVAATAAIVQGERAIDWLRAHRLPARLVETDGTIHFLGPWPDPQQITA